MAWRINSYSLPKPDKFDISYIEIADYSRDINGKLYKDVVGRVRKFTVRYNGLDKTDTENIRVQIETSDIIILEYEYHDTTQSATVTLTQGTISRLPSTTEMYSISLTFEETTAI